VVASGALAARRRARPLRRRSDRRLIAFLRAAYDGWSYIKGLGILDKRSLLVVDGGAARPGPAARQAVSS
jgi:hypothetical protein